MRVPQVRPGPSIIHLIPSEWSLGPTLWLVVPSTRLHFVQFGDRRCPVARSNVLRDALGITENADAVGALVALQLALLRTNVLLDCGAHVRVEGGPQVDQPGGSFRHVHTEVFADDEAADFGGGDAVFSDEGVDGQVVLHRRRDYVQLIQIQTQIRLT